MTKVLTINVKPIENHCNLRCSYCDAGHETEDIPFQCSHYISSIRQIEQNYDWFHIVLHGGEPLLTPLKALKDIIVRTKDELLGKCDFQIQTNGLLLSDNVYSFLMENNCRLSISFDPPKGNLRCDNQLYRRIKSNILKSVAAGCNPGIVSVAHAQNHSYFIDFLKELCDIGIEYWTINKIRTHIGSPYHLSEGTYLDLLLQTTKEWIDKGLFQRISIQPINDLLSPNENHSCHFSSVRNKCECFSVYSKNKLLSSCEHLSNTCQPLLSRCDHCDIFAFCGGGCPTDFRDDAFCQSRHLFFSSLEQIKHLIGVYDNDN